MSHGFADKWCQFRDAIKVELERNFQDKSVGTFRDDMLFGDGLNNSRKQIDDSLEHTDLYCLDPM